MKLTVLFLLFAFVSLHASVYSQNTGLNLKVQNTSIKDVLREIEDQSEFFFMYNNQKVDVLRKVSLDLDQKKVDEILDEIFEGSNVRYTIKDRQIVLFTEGEQIPGNDTSVDLIQQNITISGKITDSSGMSLPGVTVVVKGTTQGTISDADGNYNLTNVPSDAILLFSFVGMKTEEVPVNGKSTINVILSEEAIGIEEVVAIGYGTQKKVNLTGAISVVDAEVLEDRPIASTAQGLQGVIPNLNINITSGDPSDRNATDYNIRGFESINGGSPYILVDGVPMDIEDINPSDIESITVLKDASASAIYGGKAAFGVILVTTKTSQGKGKVTVKYSHETALSSPILRGYDVVDNSYDHVYYQNLMKTNDGQAQEFENEVVDATKAYYENPDSAPEYAIRNNRYEFYGYHNWKELLLNDFSPSYKHNFSVSGGTEKINVFASFSNFQKDGIYKIGNDKYERNNVLIKVQEKAADWISFDQKVAVNMIKSNKMHKYQDQSLGIASIFQNAPNRPYLFPDAETDYPELSGKYFHNIAGYLAESGRQIERNTVTWLTAGMDLNPLKNVHIRSELSYVYANKKSTDNILTITFAERDGLVPGADNLTTNGFTTPSSASLSMNDSRGYIFNTYAEYELTDLENHYVKAMVGFNQESRKWDRISGTASQLITNAVPHISAALGDRVLKGNSDLYTLRGAFYRLNYIYKDRYLVELSGRYDGSSRFPTEDRFGFFPSGSVGWRLSEENFMKDIDFVDNIKLRASYGELGNQLISYAGQQQYHPYQATLGIETMSYLLFDNSQEFDIFTTMPELISSSLTWETVATTDFGLDFTLLNQRLNGSFDYYIRETQGMLMKKKYPEILSATAPFENGADLQNKGWEFSIGWRDKISNDFSYGLRFALWDSKTEITKFYNPTGSLASNTYYEGQVLGEIWGYETEGLFQTEDDVANGPDQSSLGSGWQPGDIWIKDQLTVDTDGDGIPDEGDGIINSGTNTLDDHGDLKIIGNNMPRYSYSLNIDLDYKNWSLMAFFQGVAKRDWYPHAREWWPWDTGTAIKTTDITDSWSENNTDGYWYRATSNGAKNHNMPMTRWLQDASYLRLKSLVLTYDLPKSLIQKVGMSKASVFVGGHNLWELSNLLYNRDPEQNTGNNLAPENSDNTFHGPNSITYPSQRTVSVGVNLTF